MNKTLLSFFAVLFALTAQAQTIIEDQPEGDVKLYVRSGITYENFMGFWNDVQDGYTSLMVYAADGKTVYWKNPVTRYDQDTWIEGTLSDDGSTISFPAGQTLYQKKSKKTTVNYQLYYLKNVVLDEDGYYYESFEVDKETPITLAVDGNTLTLQGTTDDLSSIIGVVTDDDDPAWNYYGDAQTVLSLFDEQPVTAPEGLLTETYKLTYGSGATTIVNLGVSGNDLYVQGIYSKLPEAWLHGTIDGNKVTVESGQYFGMASDGTILYWVGAQLDSIYNAKWDDYDYVYNYCPTLTFTYDPETRSYSADSLLIASYAQDAVKRYATFAAPKLTPYVEVSGTPADPEITDFALPEAEDEDDSPEGSITFFIYAKDVEGRDLNSSKLYYRLYIDDDQLFTLSPEIYENLDEPMSEFSYAFTEDWDFVVNTSTGRHKIYLYQEVQRFGVQAIFRDGDEEYFSNIVYTDGSKTATGIKTIATTTDKASTVLYDLQGRRIQTALPGQLVIRRTIGADGSVSTVKVVK